MKRKIKDTLEEIVIILIAFVILLMIIASIVIVKRFVSKIQSNVETVPKYEDHMPQYQY